MSSRCEDSLESSPPVSDPRPRRLSALADGLTAAHIDGLLITSLPNIRYLTGFSGSSALLFVSVRDVVLITDFRYQTQVIGEVGDRARVSIEPQSLWAGLWQQLSQLPSLEVVGFEIQHDARVVDRDGPHEVVVLAGRLVPAPREGRDPVQRLRRGRCSPCPFGKVYPVSEWSHAPSESG